MERDLLGSHVSSHPNGLSQALIEGGIFPILVVAPDSTISFANGLAGSSLGYEPLALQGMPLEQLLDVGSRAKAAALLAAARGGTTSLYELNLVARDGRVVLLGVHATPLEDGSVALVGQMLAPAVATTERLLDTNRQLQSLFAVATETSNALLFPDLLNKALNVMHSELGLRAGAIWLAAPSQNAPPLEDDSLFLAAQRGFANHAVVHGPALLRRIGFFPEGDTQTWIRTGTFDDIGLAPDDLLGVVGPLISMVVLPLQSESRRIGWLLAVSDAFGAFRGDKLRTLQAISQLLGPPIEHARLFKAFVERSSQLQAVLDGIDSGVMLVDNGGIVRYANARLGTVLAADVSHWPGMRRSDLPLGNLIPQPHSYGVFAGELLLAPGLPDRLLRRLVDHVADADGQPLGTVEIFNDVTAVEEMNQLKDDFIAAAAHDLKTPVTAVKGYAQIALRLARRIDEPRLIQQLEQVSARSDDLTYLIDTLLDLSRIQSGRLVLDVAPFVLNDLVTEVVGRFHKTMQRQNRAIAVEMPDELVQVEWDKARISRILSNLVENGIKYSPDGGELYLSLALLEKGDSVQQWVEIAVTDRGIGIPPAERSRVFERFYRTTQVVSEGFNGTGLGLYICQQLVAAHGGTIAAADARHGGSGTTMIVHLPNPTVVDRT